jgi:hypothetical protein
MLCLKARASTFEERAAILEFDGKMTRNKAESTALASRTTGASKEDPIDSSGDVHPFPPRNRRRILRSRRSSGPLENTVLGKAGKLQRSSRTPENQRRPRNDLHSASYWSFADKTSDAFITSLSTTSLTLRGTRTITQLSVLSCGATEYNSNLRPKRSETIRRDA